ncbi:2Fe-2S iron-sulfur cluster-binding protein [Streptomyces sp. 8N616]|uniref:2Fe-2S iron-sulfur cluster-binding protein n=1 Tax=Streptomyces sp. 8N616 TaxID=3457414 RepID=UPI003FD0C5E5
MSSTNPHSPAQRPEHTTAPGPIAGQDGAPCRRNNGALRAAQGVFALFCLVAAIVLYLRPDPAFPVLQTAGVAGYLLAAPLVAVAGWALARPVSGARARRTLIVFHLAFVPLQFLFSFGNYEPLGGMLASAVLAVLMKPLFGQLGRRARKVWLMLHIGFSVSWLGLSLAMAVMSVVGLTADDHGTRRTAYDIMHLFDLTLVIPSMALALITGVVVSVGTPWGLIRHWWVLLKFVIALSLPLFAAFFEHKWIKELQALEPSQEPGGTGLALVVCLVVFTVLLWTAVFLSVFKPGGRTRWGRRAAAARSAGSSAKRVPAAQTPVTVAAVRRAAEQVVELDLRRPDGGELPTWQPGAHVDLVLPSGTVRQYSLCGDPEQRDVYRIAVLREPRGRGGSVEAHTLAPGAAVAVRGPRNHFRLADAPSYLFLAGGIGIAPLLPMIRQLAARGADWRLVYRGGSRRAMAYADDLLRDHPDRVLVSVSDTDPRPDLAGLLAGTPRGVAVYCCGPAPLMDAVAATMPAACPQWRLHLERFAAATRSGTGPDTPFEAELACSGRIVPVPVGTSLLTALQTVEATLDFSCEGGVCGSCETRVLDGAPDHRDGVLQPHERDRRDVIHPCVSRAHGPRIVLDL